jgi:hypothetical protein
MCSLTETRHNPRPGEAHGRVGREQTSTNTVVQIRERQEPAVNPIDWTAERTDP